MKSSTRPEKKQPRIIFNKETGIPLQAFLESSDAVSIDIGAHIDPEGHNLYDPKVDGISLAVVPVDVEESMQRLHHMLDKKQYAARALEHSRRLMILYLAGKQNGKDF